MSTVLLTYSGFQKMQLTELNNQNIYAEKSQKNTQKRNNSEGVITHRNTSVKVVALTKS